MSDSPSQSALRETRRLLSSRQTLAALAGVTMILAISGPFGTIDYMRLAPRVVYWAIIAVSTFSAGTFIGNYVLGVTKQRQSPRWVLALGISLLVGTSTLVIVVTVNWLAMQVPLTEPGYLVMLVPSTYAVSTVIALLLSFARAEATTEVEAAKAPTLLDRLPFDKRGALVSLSVSDHYVEVVTDKGAELVLIRLGDAMKETEGVNGMQVHRSHWVALDQVQSAKRSGDRAILTMSDGRDIPVSRSYVPAIKQAGLLPK